MSNKLFISQLSWIFVKKKARETRSVTHGAWWVWCSIFDWSKTQTECNWMNNNFLLWCRAIPNLLKSRGVVLYNIAVFVIWTLLCVIWTLLRELDNNRHGPRESQSSTVSSISFTTFQLTANRTCAVSPEQQNTIRIYSTSSTGKGKSLFWKGLSSDRNEGKVSALLVPRLRG